MPCHKKRKINRKQARSLGIPVARFPNTRRSAHRIKKKLRK